jgi:hypothetical protein
MLNYQRVNVDFYGFFTMNHRGSWNRDKNRPSIIGIHDSWK